MNIPLWVFMVKMLFFKKINAWHGKNAGVAWFIYLLVSLVSLTFFLYFNYEKKQIPINSKISNQSLGNDRERNNPKITTSLVGEDFGRLQKPQTPEELIPSIEKNITVDNSVELTFGRFQNTKKIMERIPALAPLPAE